MTGEKAGMVPIPDPTKLTTDAVAAAKVELKDLFDTKLRGLRELVDEKFEGRDKAISAALKSAEALVQQQNESNTRENDKTVAATTKQIDALALRVDDIKDAVSEFGKRNYAAVGGYLVGAVGIIAAIGAIVAIVAGKH